MSDKQPFRRYYKAWDRRADNDLDGSRIVIAMVILAVVLIVASVWYLTR